MNIPFDEGVPSFIAPELEQMAAGRIKEAALNASIKEQAIQGWKNSWTNFNERVTGGKAKGPANLGYREPLRLNAPLGYRPPNSEPLRLSAPKSYNKLNAIREKQIDNLVKYNLPTIGLFAPETSILRKSKLITKDRIYASMAERSDDIMIRYTAHKSMMATRLKERVGNSATSVSPSRFLTRGNLKSNLNKLWGLRKNKFVGGALFTAGLAAATAITTPIFSAVGNFVAGQSETMNRLSSMFNNRSLEFGGKIHTSYMNGPGMTERQRALGELQRSRTNARTFVGNEASLLHQ